MKKFTAKATLQIQQPAATVYEAIVNPEQMTKYFISSSSGRMTEGADLNWKFPEFPEEFPVGNIRLEERKFVSFVWDPQTRVEIRLEEMNDGSTVVQVTEGEKEFNEANLIWAISNTEGWANFLACMKAYLEYGVQLRRGAFDFMKSE